MDDFNILNLNESKNEWCARLINILAPLINEGFRSIFDEGYKLCIENDEEDKYLMTFQNLISRIPKWNENMIDTEKTRIIENSGCNYLEDLISCVHIAQLKVLTCIRVGQKQKAININIPNLANFIHLAYIHCARKIYTTVYLFNKNLDPLDIQKNNCEVEKIIRENILNAIRESIPINEILRAYIDETYEEDIIEENKEIVETSTIDASGEKIETSTVDKKETVIPKSFESNELEQLSDNTRNIVKENAKPLIPILKNNNEPMTLAGNLETVDDIGATKGSLDTVGESGYSGNLFNISRESGGVTDTSSDSLKSDNTFLDIVNLNGFSNKKTRKPEVNDIDYGNSNDDDNYNTSSSFSPGAGASNKHLRFNDFDKGISIDNREEIIPASKSIDRLEQISEERNQQRKLDEMEDDDDDDDKIKISDDANVDLGILDIEEITNMPMI